MYYVEFRGESCSAYIYIDYCLYSVSDTVCIAVLYLFNGELFACHFSHLCDGVHVGIKTHLQTLAEGESCLWLDVHTQLLTQLLPVPARNNY